MGVEIENSYVKVVKKLSKIGVRIVYSPPYKGAPDRALYLKSSVWVPIGYIPILVPIGPHTKKYGHFLAVGFEVPNCPLTTLQCLIDVT